MSNAENPFWALALQHALASAPKPAAPSTPAAATPAPSSGGSARQGHQTLRVRVDEDTFQRGFEQGLAKVGAKLGNFKVTYK